MARIHMMELDDLINSVKADAERAPQRFKQACDVGGEVLKKHIVEKIGAFGVVDTGALMISVEAYPTTRKGDAYYVEAGPQGTRTDAKHKKPERNETVGFVQDRGRRYSHTVVEGKHFIDAAKESAEPEIIEKVKEVLGGDTFGR